MGDTANEVKIFFDKMTADLQAKKDRRTFCYEQAQVADEYAKRLREEATALGPEIDGLAETLEALKVFSPYLTTETPQVEAPVEPRPPLFTVEVEYMDDAHEPMVNTTAAKYDEHWELKVKNPKLLETATTLEIRPEAVVSLRNAPRAIQAHNTVNGRPQAFRKWRLRNHQHQHNLEGNFEPNEPVKLKIPGKNHNQHLKVGTAAREYACHECGSVIEKGYPYVRIDDLTVMSLRASTPQEDRKKLPESTTHICQKCCVFDIELVVWQDVIQSFGLETTKGSHNE